MMRLEGDNIPAPFGPPTLLERFFEELEWAKGWQQAYDERRKRYRGEYKLMPSTERQYLVWAHAAMVGAIRQGMTIAAFILQKKPRHARRLRDALFWWASRDISAHRAALERNFEPWPHLQRSFIEQMAELRLLQKTKIPCTSPKVKRYLTRKWPASWREDALRELPARWHVPFLVSACCGCRPGEMAIGVRVRLMVIEERKYIEFRIVGLKVTDISGQPFRKLTIRGDRGVFAVPLYAAIEADPKTYGDGVTRLRERIVSVPRPVALSEALARVAKRVPSLNGLCPMMLRHQFAADLKRAKVCLEDRCRALGHINDLTVSWYGKRGFKTGTAQSFHVVDVQVPRELHLKRLERGDDRFFAQKRREQRVEAIRARDAREELARNPNRDRDRDHERSR